MQNVRLGVLNVYKHDAATAHRCRRTRWRYAFSEVVDCLTLNEQDVPALGSKFNVRPFAGNLFTVANSFGQRVESIRSADDLHPTFETTNKMAYMVKSDSTYDLGPRFWNHGHLGSELEVRRSAHVQRPLAGGRVVRPSLLVQLDRSADAGAAVSCSRCSS